MISHFCLPGQKYAKIPKWLKDAMKSSSRIVGGNDAPAPIPWQVHIHYKRYGFACGGTILDEETILSAAHCMFPLSDPADYIAAGIKREGSLEGQKIDVKDVIIHPQYNESRAVAKFDNDIAILKLKEPLTFNADVQPARLPDSTLNPEDKGTFATISGWGTVSSLGPSSKDLKFAFVPILGVDKCVNLNSLYTPSNITSNMICAGDLTDGGEDSCQGDSGGPLIIPKSDSDDTVIVYGVVSWGDGCADQKGPGMYARVSNYNSWIQGYMTKPKKTSPTKTTTKKPKTTTTTKRPKETATTQPNKTTTKKPKITTTKRPRETTTTQPNKTTTSRYKCEGQWICLDNPKPASIDKCINKTWQSPGDCKNTTTERPNQNGSISCLNHGEKYEGSANQTAFGDACLPWSTPGLPILFEGQDNWSHNYCRNSGGLDDIPICYVDKSTVEECEIPICDLRRIKRT